MVPHAPDRLPRAGFLYQVHHVFLPPKLPQQDDFSESSEHELLQTVLGAMERFQCHVDQPAEFQPAIAMMRAKLACRPGGNTLHKQSLINAFQNIRSGDTLGFQLRSQNAGLLITRRGEVFQFEPFELLAQNENVMTEGRLTRRFPASCVELPHAQFADANFQTALADLLIKLDEQEHTVCRPQTRKKGKDQSEERDTIDPKLVSGMMMGLLLGLGKASDPVQIQKQSREDVQWHDAKLPWHRSPFWLFLRVALRLVLDRGTMLSRLPYKQFMLFLMSTILGHGPIENLPCHLIQSMLAKVHRRRHKLLQAVSPRPSWLLVCSDSVSRASTAIQKTWNKVQKEETRYIDLDALKDLNFPADTALRLGELQGYLDWISRPERHSDSKSSKNETPGFPFRRLPADALPRMKFEQSSTLIYQLTDFEDWVSHNYQSWLRAHVAEPGTCTLLATLIENYHAAASGLYSENPLNLSTMWLTILELWIGCDSSATHIHPLLLDYWMQFPIEILQYLTLATKSQMKRLCAAEQYLGSRKAKTRASFPSAFGGYGDSRCFAARFYDSSASHQALHQTIRTAAQAARSAKLLELQEKKQKHSELMREYDGAAHETQAQLVGGHENRHWENVCVWSCRKCSLLAQAKGMRISVHEWPLPDSDQTEKCVVFELDVPVVISAWRNITMELLTNLLCDRLPAREELSIMYLAIEYSDLRQHAKTTRQQRLQLISTVKPFTIAHYHDKPVSEATADNICQAHGCEYNYYDEVVMQKPSSVLGTSVVPSNCSFAAVSRQNKTLAQWIRYSSHSSNEVIASQSICAGHLNLEDFKAFGHVRSGARLQWINILTQVSMPALDLNSSETALVLLQACYEAGPNIDKDDSALRDAHGILERESFGLSLVKGLRDATTRVEKNWECENALLVFVCLTARLLSISPSLPVQEQCLAFLRHVRHTARDLVASLRDKIAAIQSSSDKDDLYERTLRMALVSSLTYNVNIPHIERILGNNEDATCLIETAIIIHDFLGKNRRCSGLMTMLVQSWHRLCLNIRPIVVNKLRRSSGWLDEAIRLFWSSYLPGSSWKALTDDRDHIVTSLTSATDGLKRMRISLDLLTGSFLVDGCPLSRLPSEYQEHPTYQRLFGSQILEVIPSERPGMRFSASRQQQGWNVHFSSFESELIIRAYREEEVWEFIPPVKLTGDFPILLINPYSHWIDIKTGQLEFRHVHDPWNSAGDLWRSVMVGSKRSLTKGTKTLIDMSSRTFEGSSRVLGVLELPKYLIMTVDSMTKSLVVELPRYDLCFTLEAGSSLLRSKQYPGMCVDGDQSVGTLFGLQSQLVMRSEGPMDSRAIIIPHGRFRVSRGIKKHPIIDILHPPVPSPMAGLPIKMSRRRHHFYRINTRLGEVVDNGSLQAKLLLCYAHAVTTFCVPDPLTKRTGTEEALRILGSAAVVSFERLGAEDIRMLQDIAELSPIRRFYPRHLRVMEETKWSSVLDPIAQSDAFGLGVSSVLARGRDCEMFFPADSQTIEELKGSEISLVQRALIRNAYIRVPGFGRESFTTSRDMRHISRAVITEGSNLDLLQRRSGMIATYLAEGQQGVLDETIQSSSLMSRIYAAIDGQANGPETYPDIDLRFDIQWLDAPQVSIGRRWLSIQRLLSASRLSSAKYALMTFFGALVYAEEATWDVTRALLAFATVPALRQVAQPSFESFELFHGHEYRPEWIEGAVHGDKALFGSSLEGQLPRARDEEPDELADRRQQAWNTKVRLVKFQFQEAIANQWPCMHPSTPLHHEYRRYLAVDDAISSIRAYFQLWEKNRRFHIYLESAASIISSLPLLPTSVTTTMTCRAHLKLARTLQASVEVTDLFAHDPPPITSAPVQSFKEYWGTTPLKQEASSSEAPVQQLLISLRQRATQPYEHEYAEELGKSLSSLQLNSDGDPAPQLWNLDGILEKYAEDCRVQVEKFQSAIFRYLRGFDGEGDLAVESNCFPRLSPIFILQQLNRHRWPTLSGAWKGCVVQYAVALTHLQRAERLLSARDHYSELLREMRNTGHTWDPMKFPDSLLLEVESGIMIREVQEEVAAPMRASKANSVMQLNMGEGKSSVIVQIVAAHLADGDRLVRVIVAKPQSKQMRQMLITKLGGLLDRQVFGLPFSRSIVMDVGKVRRIQGLIDSCRKAGGVLLIQPEHILSFKLMGLEYAGAAEPSTQETGLELIKTQKLLDRISRDIIDESDENFSVKFELIYTIGQQKPVQMSPDRWLIIQAVLTLVYQNAAKVKDAMPDFLQLPPQEAGRFGTLRILKETAGQYLLECVAQHICDCGIPGLAIGHATPAIRQALLRYITQTNVPEEFDALIQRHFSDSSRLSILLLRGLFAGGVLAFALGQKRWRVNYGLATRTPPTMLAVPYRAKDSPAPRSEFSHPDVVIVLTCLSYYYGGLSTEDMFTTVEQLQLSDQSNEIFSEWVRASPSLPDAFRQLSGINLKDKSQCIGSVFPALRRSKPVVDYYLDKVVFPKEMMEFPQKLSASGWDLAKTKSHPVTGFSGTCDSKYVLPLDVAHLDLPKQMHTNAMVLQCLLRRENLVRELGPALDSESLLKAVVQNDPPVEVLLDVGALIIELNNKQVARKWLALTPTEHKQAALYFDDDDQLMVVTRDGRSEPFTTSPFAGNTGSCLVFLDEAHTRGIDVKLPEHYRAATTLGPKLTKDRNWSVVACMRMRKLGKGQSVVFFVPQEIQDKIRHCVSVSKEKPLAVADVLCWSISETWSDTQRSVPLWASQGLRYQRQETIWGSHIASTDELSLGNGELADYFENEAMTLGERYLPKRQKASEVLANEIADTRLVGRKKQLELIRSKCEHFKVMSFSSATLQEEQERELAPEIEQERQIEKPQPMEPLPHKIHPDLAKLVQTGTLRLVRGGAFRAAFRSFEDSSMAGKIETSQFGEELLVTADFARTVALTHGSRSDAFHRNVQWILSFNRPAASGGHIRLLVLSPWEANELLPQIERSRFVHLHTYAPRPNLSLPTLQDLKLCVTPPLPPRWSAPSGLVMQLNLFAGQLYFETLEEYRELCGYLGLSWQPNDGSRGIAADGFVGRDMYPRCRFRESPTAFLRFVMANIRRDRQDISRTHLGRMLSGEILGEADFENDEDS
ncbi:hypothetical protein GGR56DRAFT_636982 [Xylariaceae sp. FL0804]|nr:hypothetical protein GGR56DRAFT_636982 [Xylariaceae sp. FL0804]